MIVVAADACNVTPPAATVNGAQISEGAFNSELQQVASNTDVRCAIGILTGQTIPRQGAGTDTIPTDLADAELSQLIEQKLYYQELASLGSSVTSTYLGYAKAFFPQYLTPTSGTSSPCGLSGSQLVSALPSWFVNRQIEILAAEERLVTLVGHVNLGQSGIDAFYKNNKSDFDELCLDAIATQTQAEANADRTKVLDGASWSSVAATSLDPQLGEYGYSQDGAYQCVPSTYIVDELPNWAGVLDNVDLKTGGVSAVFQDSPDVDEGGTGAYLFLKITKRQLQPLTQSVALDIQEYLVSEHASVLTSVQRSIFKKASVTVDPQYGSWSNGKTGGVAGVLSPAVPKSEYLLDPNADKSTS